MRAAWMYSSSTGSVSGRIPPLPRLAITAFHNFCWRFSAVTVALST